MLGLEKFLLRLVVLLSGCFWCGCGGLLLLFLLVLRFLGEEGGGIISNSGWGEEE